MLYLCMILHLSYLEMAAIWRGKEKFKCCNTHEHMRRNWESKTLMCRFGWTEGLILNISELKNCFHFSVTGPWLIYAWVKPFSVITLGNFKLKKNYFPLRKGSNEFQLIFFFSFRDRYWYALLNMLCTFFVSWIYLECLVD